MVQQTSLMWGKQRMLFLLSLFLNWGSSWRTNPNSLPPLSAQLGLLVPLLPLHHGCGRPSGMRRCEAVQKEVFLTLILVCQNLRITVFRSSRAEKACPEQVLLFLKRRAKPYQIWGRREREGASCQGKELLYCLHERRSSTGSRGRGGMAPAALRLPMVAVLTQMAEWGLQNQDLTPAEWRLLPLKTCFVGVHSWKPCCYSRILLYTVLNTF